jgi:hypothetical protein
MKRFSVVVRTTAGDHRYSAIAADWLELHAAAIDRFGPCYVSVRPL